MRSSHVAVREIARPRLLQLRTSERARLGHCRNGALEIRKRGTDDADDDVMYAKRPNEKVAQLAHHILFAVAVRERARLRLLQLRTSERARFGHCRNGALETRKRGTDDADGDVIHAKRPNGKVAQDRRCLPSCP